VAAQLLAAVRWRADRGPHRRTQRVEAGARMNASRSVANGRFQVAKLKLLSQEAACFRAWLVSALMSRFRSLRAGTLARATATTFHERRDSTPPVASTRRRVSVPGSLARACRIETHHRVRPAAAAGSSRPSRCSAPRATGLREGGSLGRLTCREPLMGCAGTLSAPASSAPHHQGH
jgi:hypothetical protein